MLQTGVLFVSPAFTHPVWGYFCLHRHYIICQDLHLESKIHVSVHLLDT